MLYNSVHWHCCKHNTVGSLFLPFMLTPRTESVIFTFLGFTVTEKSQLSSLERLHMSFVNRHFI